MWVRLLLCLMDVLGGVNSDGFTLIIAFVRLGVLCVYVIV